MLRKMLAVFLLGLLWLSGCSGAPTQTAPAVAAQVTGEESALPLAGQAAQVPHATQTPQAAPKAQEAPSFVIPASQGSSPTRNAVVGGYWVSADGALRSLPLGEAGAQPLVLDEEYVWSLNVWGDYVAVYVRPEPDHPYRIVLYKPDGSERIVLPFTQSEFINPRWMQGDYCYAHEAGEIRRLSLSTNELISLFPLPVYNVLGVVNGSMMAFDFSKNRLYAYSLTEIGDDRALDVGLDVTQAMVCDGGVLLTGESDAYFVEGDLTVRHIGGKIQPDGIFSYCPQYISAGRHGLDALGGYYARFLIGAQGVYPYDEPWVPTPTGEMREGAAVMDLVDPTELIPLDRFPELPIEPVPLSGP